MRLSLTAALQDSPGDWLLASRSLSVSVTVSVCDHLSNIPSRDAPLIEPKWWILKNITTDFCPLWKSPHFIIWWWCHWKETLMLLPIWPVFSLVYGSFLFSLWTDFLRFSDVFLLLCHLCLGVKLLCNILSLPCLVHESLICAARCRKSLVFATSLQRFLGLSLVARMGAAFVSHRVII